MGRPLAAWWGLKGLHDGEKTGGFGWKLHDGYDSGWGCSACAAPPGCLPPAAAAELEPEYWTLGKRAGVESSSLS